MKATHIVSFSFLGVSLGVLVAFSDSPVISQILATLLVLVAIIAAIASGIRDVRLLQMFQRSEVQESSDLKVKLQSFSPVPITIIVFCFLIGGVAGIYFRNHWEIFEIDLNRLQERWYSISKIDTDKLLVKKKFQFSYSDTTKSDSIQKVRIREWLIDSLDIEIRNCEIKRSIALSLFNYYYREQSSQQDEQSQEIQSQEMPDKDFMDLTKHKKQHSPVGKLDREVQKSITKIPTSANFGARTPFFKSETGKKELKPDHNPNFSSDPSLFTCYQRHAHIIEATERLVKTDSNFKRIILNLCIEK